LGPSVLWKRFRARRVTAESCTFLWKAKERKPTEIKGEKEETEKRGLGFKKLSCKTGKG